MIFNTSFTKQSNLYKTISPKLPSVSWHKMRDRNGAQYGRSLRFTTGATCARIVFSKVFHMRGTCSKMLISLLVSLQQALVALGVGFGVVHGRHEGRRVRIPRNIEREVGNN